MNDRIEIICRCGKPMQILVSAETSVAIQICCKLPMYQEPEIEAVIKCDDCGFCLIGVCEKALEIPDKPLSAQERGKRIGIQVIQGEKHHGD